MILHLRYEGRSFDLDSRKVGLKDSPSDRDIREAVARHLDVALSKLDGYVVDRVPNGNLVLRPEAVYG